MQEPEMLARAWAARVQGWGARCRSGAPSAPFRRRLEQVAGGLERVARGIAPGAAA